MAEQTPKTDDKSIALWLQESSPSLKMYAVTNYKQEAFIKSAMLAIVDNQNLKECMSTPSGKISVFNALRYAASTGLSLNPQEGKAALIAYGGKVQYQVMKNGIIELAMRSGVVEFVTCDVVRSNDKFDIKKTAAGDDFDYSPARKDRGNIDGFFAACKLKSGSTHVKYMTIEEVEEHRDKYSAMFKSKPELSPWSKSFEGMGLKTVIKNLFRNLTISQELTAAIGGEDASENEIINITPKGANAETVKAILTEKQADVSEKPVETDTQKKMDF